MPGHGGPDSATTELIGRRCRCAVLPGLALVTVLGLAGGVSLGPENPIIAINGGDHGRPVRAADPAGARADRDAARRRGDGRGAVRHAGRGGAAVHGHRRRGEGAAGRSGTGCSSRSPPRGPARSRCTSSAPRRSQFDLPAYGSPQAIDLLTGSLVACGAAVDRPCRARRLPHRLPRAARAAASRSSSRPSAASCSASSASSAARSRCSRASTQIGELLQDPDQYDGTQLAVIAGIKILALLVAASAALPRRPDLPGRRSSASRSGCSDTC